MYTNVFSQNNYIDFIKDDTITIDYKYIWDIVCVANPKLVTHGLNLVILEENNDDETNNISLICPSNHFSKNFFSNQNL